MNLENTKWKKPTYQKDPIHVITFVANAQKGQIYRDRKEVNGCLGLKYESWGGGQWERLLKHFLLLGMMKKL